MNERKNPHNFEACDTQFKTEGHHQLGKTVRTLHRSDGNLCQQPAVAQS